MFGNKSVRSSLLKPYVLKTRDGFLLGLTPPPEKASPCARCVQSWLQDRNVWVEQAELSQLMVRRDLIPELLTEGNPHVFYEISDDGTTTRLDALVFPHPKCDCNRLNYIPTPQVNKQTNFAFSPIVQLKVARFGTPDGNLWMSAATGQAPLTGAMLTTYGVERDKDVARFKAVDEWLKRAVATDLPTRLERGELVPSEVLQTGNVELITKMQVKPASFEGMGVGANRDEATLDALVNLAKLRTLRRYSNAMKNPMLIVGANNWVRSKVPFFLLQQYDIHLVFYPNSTPAWVVGLIAFSRHNTSEKPVFVFAAHSEITRAMDQLFFRLLEVLRPSEDELFTGRISENTQHNPKLHMWWTHWIYRCPKISLKDVLHLEPYPKSIDHWRNYFKDGQEMVSVMNVNNEFLSSQIRSVVKLNCASSDAVSVSRNVNGIGIWRDFADALA